MASLRGNWNKKFRRSFLLYKDFTSTTIVSIIIVGINFIQGVLLARYLGVEGRGEFAAVIYFTTYVSGFVSLGIPQIITRGTLLEKNQNYLKNGLVASFLAGFLGTIISVCFVNLMMPPEKEYLNNLAMLYACFLPFTHMTLCLQAFLRGKENYNLLNTSRLLLAFVFPLCIVLTGSLTTINTVVITVISVLSSVLIFISIMLVTSRQYSVCMSASILQSFQLIKDGWRFSIATITSNALLRLDVLVVTAVASIKFQGLYAVATSISMLMLVIPNTASIFYFNTGARQTNKESGRRFFKVFLFAIIFQIIAGGILYVISYLLVGVVYGTEFIETMTLLPISIGIYGTIGVVSGIENYLQGGNRPLVQIMPKLISATCFLCWAYYMWDVRSDNFSILYVFFFCCLLNLGLLIFLSILNFKIVKTDAS